MNFLNMAFLSAVFIFSALSGSTYAAVTSTEVKWSATASPGLVKINAVGGTAQGTWTIKEGMGSGTFETLLNDYKTGIDLRDEHMRKNYLETDKFPKATLVVNPVKVGDKFDWSGQLTLKGITKTVNGSGSITGSDFNAEFTVNIEDFPNLKVPSYLGITMAKTVLVSVKGKI